MFYSSFYLWGVVVGVTVGREDDVFEGVSVWVKGDDGYRVVTCNNNSEGKGRVYGSCRSADCWRGGDGGGVA